MSPRELVNVLMAGSHSLELPDAIVGVYFLIHNEEVVYVGQSHDIIARVRAHRNDYRKRKLFDSVRYIECESERLDAMEYRCIELFKPKYNQRRRSIGLPPSTICQ